MSGHTPGPWEFGEGYKPGDSTFELFAPGGRQIMSHSSYENMWLSNFDKEIDAANARLMAAAPELLAACLAGLCVAEAEGANANASVIRAAIAKATQP